MRRRAIADAGKWAGARIASGLDAAFGARRTRRFGILVAHRVSPVIAGVPRPTVNLQPDVFRSLVDGLLRSGFEFWPLSRVLESASQGAPIPGNVVVLTFDDGYRSVYSNVWPVLEARRIPMAVFVTTAYVGTDAPFPFDDWAAAARRDVPSEAWRPLSWDECRELERSGLVEIGSHSHTHANFRNRPDELASDIETSRVVLDRELGARPRPFAFPFGSVKSGFADPALADVVRRSRYTCALTTEIELVDDRTDPYSWGRIELVDGDTSRTIRAKLHGWYSWMNTGRSVYWAARRLLR